MRLCSVDHSSTLQMRRTDEERVRDWQRVQRSDEATTDDIAPYHSLNRLHCWRNTTDSSSMESGTVAADASDLLSIAITFESVELSGVHDNSGHNQCRWSDSGKAGVCE